MQIEINKHKTQVRILKATLSEEQLKPLKNDDSSCPHTNIKSNIKISKNLSLQSISKATTQKQYCLVNFKKISLLKELSLLIVV